LYNEHKGGDVRMKKRVTFTLEESLTEKLKKVSADTMIPQSKLIEKSLESVLKKYGKREERNK
jgi:metal-responsive CopG/Arc/MetJ family transcriptional regulator